jgi:hypothetical protein
MVYYNLGVIKSYPPDKVLGYMLYLVYMTKTITIINKAPTGDPLKTFNGFAPVIGCGQWVSLWSFLL